MPPVTGKPQLGGEEATDVADHEKGRPPDEIYEDDKMDTSSRRFPSASMSKSTEIFDKDSEQLGPFASWKGKRKLDYEETYPHFPDRFQSEDEEIVDEESADAMGPGPSDTTEPHDDNKHRDNLAQSTIDDIWGFGFAENQALGLMGLRDKKYWKWEIENSEHAFQQQRACLVHGTWASIENVRKISSSLLVNKPQCEHIADHFKVIGDVLKKLGLGKDFVSGQVLEGGSGIQSNLTFDETRFIHIAETFEERFDEFGFLSLRKTEIQNWSRKFEEYMVELPAMDGSSEKSLSVQSKINEGFTPRWSIMKEKIEARSDYRVQHPLDEFLYFLFGVLKQGEDLVLFHSELKGANNGLVKGTGLCGEKFVQIHELLYELLDCYGCLEDCEGTEFASGYLSRFDSCGVQSLLYYSNSNCLGKNASLDIDNNFLSIEMATQIAKMVKDPNCALKKLFIKSWPGFKVDQEELRKCRLMIISALSESVGLTSLTLCGSNGKEVHELCKSLRANRVLENLVILTYGPLADNDAMDLSAMLKENHSLKSFTLEFDDVSPEGVHFLGRVLSKISLDKIYLRSRKSRGLRRFFKYLLGLLMAYIDGKCIGFLSLEDHHSFFEIQRIFSLEGWELSMGASNIQLLRLHQTPNRLSIKFKDLDPDAICEILDFLKKNKTLQVLELESWREYGQNLGDNPEVAACLEALLAENSSLTELKVKLKVKFHAWDKCFVKHLLRPLMAEKDGEPPVNISLRQLHINYLDSEMISNSKFSLNQCVEVVESIAQMLRTNKTLSHFSMINARLRPSDICAIVDSLKTNKALQLLNLKSKVFDDPQVKVAFIDLLVNYNFTLSTINLDVMNYNHQEIETFMKNQLRFATKMTLRELRSLVCTTSDYPTANNAHDLKQAVGTLQLEEDEGLSKEEYGSSKRAFDKYKSEVEAKDERPQLLLSYSKETRDFTMQLCMELKSSNYNVVDQDSINFAEVVDQCQLAIVVLSDMYVNSKPSMSELCTIVKAKRTNNPTLKVYPLFYKLTLQDLQNAYVSASIFDGEGISLDNASEKEVLNFLCEGKNEVSRKASHLVHNLSHNGVDVGKFCEEFSELQRSSWPSNGLEFEKNAISEKGYLQAILEEIFHYMPVVKECSSDKILGHQSKLEMESKLSLRQMKPLLETLPMTDFYLQRKFNMAQHLQEKYIQYSSFEEMCSNLSHDQKHEYNKGRIVAALCPTTFLYHFKVHMFQGPCDGNFLPMLKAVAFLVAEKMQKECNQNGVETSTFFYFVDFGAPIDPRRTITTCQTFSTTTGIGEELQVENPIQYGIVQDNLTGAYYFESEKSSDLNNLNIDKSNGVIGVKVTSIEMQVEIMWEDGSYYSGALEDFAYDLELDNNKQCALEAFGDYKGAHFLRTRGLKCSPLLVIALAMAIHKKGLILTWSNGKGHIESNSILPSLKPMELEVWECQILYGGDINQLGEVVEWGMNQSDQNCASSSRNNQYQVGLEEDQDQDMHISNIPVDTSMNTWICEKPNDTSKHTLNTIDLNALASQFNAGAQDKQRWSIGCKVLGTGGEIGFEKQNSQGKKVENQSYKKMQELYWEEKGGYIIGKFHARHDLLEERLFQGSLFAERDLNYLVVYDGCTASHVSIYWAKVTRNESRLELEWITDIFIKEGPEEIKKIFKGLKGEMLEVRRRCTEFYEIPLQQNSKGLMKRFINRLSNKGSCKDINGLSNKGNCKDIALQMVPKFEGRSNDEWEHIIGLQPNIGSNQFWWKASYMQAITYSRTRYSSGLLLSTHSTKEHGLKWGSARRNSRCDESDYKHYFNDVKSCAKFSKPPESLSSKWHELIHWGGLKETLV